MTAMKSIIKEMKGVKRVKSRYLEKRTFELYASHKSKTLRQKCAWCAPGSARRSLWETVRNDIDKIVRGQTIGELPAIVKNLAII